MTSPLRRARWLFDRNSWVPTMDELSLVLSSILQSDKERVLKYVFYKDAAGTLIGRLMIRKFLSSSGNIPWKDVVVSRNDFEKPYFAPNPSLQFNISHHGRYIVLAGETDGAEVGIDVMEMKYSGGKPIKEFFRLMSRQLTEQEWKAVTGSPSESVQERAFFRIWCLKESYIKATGIGLSLPLQSLDFKFNSHLDAVGITVEDTEVFLNGEKQSNWKFQEVLLDDNYCCCTAIHVTPGNSTLDLYPSIPFSRLSFDQLTESCQAIIPRDETACLDLLTKYQQERSQLL